MCGNPDIADLTASCVRGPAKSHASIAGTKHASWGNGPPFPHGHRNQLQFDLLHAVLVMGPDEILQVTEAQLANWCPADGPGFIPFREIRRNLVTRSYSACQVSLSSASIMNSSALRYPAPIRAQSPGKPWKSHFPGFAPQVRNEHTLGGRKWNTYAPGPASLLLKTCQSVGRRQPSRIPETSKTIDRHFQECLAGLVGLRHTATTHVHLQ